MVSAGIKLFLFVLVCWAIYGEFNGNQEEEEWSIITRNSTALLDLASLSNRTIATLFKSKEGGEYITWTFIDCFYFSMETVTTVGYGDIVPGNDTAIVLTIFVCIIGVMVIGGSIGTIANWFIEKNNAIALAKQKQMLEDAKKIASGGDIPEDEVLLQDCARGEESPTTKNESQGHGIALASYFEQNPSQREAYESLPEAVQAVSIVEFQKLADEAAVQQASARKSSISNSGKKVKRRSVDETGDPKIPLKESDTGAPSQTSGVVPVKVKKGTAARLKDDWGLLALKAAVIFKCLIPIYLYIAACFILGAMEGWRGLDSIYYAIITVTTVGFGDKSPVTQEGRLFAAFLLPIGLMSLTIVLGLLVDEVPKVGQGEKTIADLLDELKEVIDQDDDGTVTEEEYLIFCLKQEGKVDQDTLDILRAQFQALDADGSGELDQDDVKQLTAVAKRKSK
jgi:voltage-gated potassium channel Kch